MCITNQSKFREQTYMYVHAILNVLLCLCKYSGIVTEETAERHTETARDV
jgi:hypothetical protein